MKTEDFIAALADGTQAVSSRALLRRLLKAALLGTAVAVACVMALYGLRADLSTAVMGPYFWIKATFTMGVAAFGFLAVERASRPGVRLGARLALLAAPFVFIAAMATIEMVHTAPPERIPVWLGQTWRSCPFSIAGLSLPPLALLLLAMRLLAPTRPAVAGLAAGLLAGGLGATAYGLHCPEKSAAFVATWYALGILGSAGIGAAVGRKLLRW